MIRFTMPSLGADMEDGVLAEWRKQPGDTVQRGDIIADVETQKGLIEVEVFEEGVLAEWLVKEGQKVPVGAVMALIRPQGEPEAEQIEERGVAAAEFRAQAKAPAASLAGLASAPARAASPSAAQRLGESAPGGQRIKVSPLARRMAEVHHLELSGLHGSGSEGAIVRRDIEAALERAAVSARGAVGASTSAAGPSVAAARAATATPTPAPAAPASAAPSAAAPAPAPVAARGAAPTPSTPGDAMRAAIASAMSKSNREIPHYYLERRIDMSRAQAWLQELNKTRSARERILLPALLVKALAAALDQVPQLNAIWEDGLHLRDAINVGFVVALRNGGIIVPAIHHADVLSIPEIMDKLNDLIPRARALKLRSSELSDSTITMTSLGENTADKVFGIIYPPQVAIVGFGALSEQPFARNGMLGIAPVMVATLAGDHRATDGLTGSRFLAALNDHLQNPDAL
jgi:pyruvate dehydrogenase E2 component (dihydrolipoamide acetyltransferase)